MALLRHDLPGEAWHYDWLLEPEGVSQDPDARILIAFRLQRRPDEAALGVGDVFPAQRMVDHRRRYLDYEGEISGGRGRVTRLASGMCRVADAEPKRVDFACDWGRGEVRWRAEPTREADQWRLVIVETGPGR